MHCFAFSVMDFFLHEAFGPYASLIDKFVLAVIVFH